MPENVHDLLVIPESGILYRMRAGIPNDQHGYRQADAVTFDDPSYRKATSIARPRLGDADDRRRGPAFSILPNKPDPSTSQVCCYLINAENARPANIWTAAEWSSEPDGEDEGLAGAQDAPVQAPLTVLLAGFSGSVFRVEIDEATAEVRAERIALGAEMEAYGQLRNGLVAGSVHYATDDTILPLINVTALL